MRRINGIDYVPFDLKDPFDRDYLRKQMWIKNPRGVEHLITMISDISVYAQGSISPEILLRDWTFLDGEPCGVKKTDLEKDPDE